MPLPKVEGTVEFEEQELKILNAVKKYYLDIYSARALEEICHREEPYIKARKGCVEGESCNAIIEKKTILSYYNSISQKYEISMSNLSNMKDYLNAILND